MREPVRTTFEARRGVGEFSKKKIRGWGAIVSGYTSEDWPPADWSLSVEDRRIVVKDMGALKDLASCRGRVGDGGVRVGSNVDGDGRSGAVIGVGLKLLRGWF